MSLPVQQNKAVLIVEDNEATAELERRALVKAGLTVRAVTQVDDAIALLRSESFVAVLLDYNLPGGDPWQVQQVAQSLVPRVPVILVTAMGSELVAAEAIHRGVDDYIKKTGDFWDQLPSIIGRAARLADAEHEISRLAAIVEASDDAITGISLDGVVVSWNSGATAMFGYSADEIIGSPNSILIPPDRSAELESIFGKLRQGERLRHFETVRVKKDGSPLDVSLTISPVKDAADKIVGISSIARDITQRKHSAVLEREVAQRKLAQEQSQENLELAERSGRALLRVLEEEKLTKLALRESEERLEFALHTIHTGGWELNLADHTAHRTLEHARIFGYGSLVQAWTYEIFLEHILPEDRAAVDRGFQAAVAAQGDWNCECRIRRADGETRWIWAVSSPRRDNEGQVRRMSGIVQDITERKRVDETLRDSEARFRCAVRETPIPMMIHDENDRVLQLSKGWTDKSGYTEADLPTLSDWTERAYGKRTGSSKDYIDGLFAINKTTSNGEWTITAKDGTKRIWDFQTTPLGSTSENKRMLLSQAVDITDRKQAETELRASEQRFRFLADNMPQIIWTSKPDGNLDYYNRRWYDYTGMTFDQTKDWGWGPVLHPDDLQNCIDRWTKAFTTGGVYEVEYRFKRAADGAYRWHLGRAFPLRSPSGEIIQWIGTCTDIEDLRQAEQALARVNQELEERVEVRTLEMRAAVEALRANEALLQEFVAHAPAAIAMLDTQMRYLQASGRWLTDYKLGRQEIIGRSHYEVFPDIPDRWKQIHQRVLAGAVESCDDDPFPRADGGMEWLQWEARPWRMADGTIGGLIFFTQVITARKQMELQLQEQKNLLERSNRDLEQFAYVASHDLQEPLRAVAGCAQILQRRYTGKLDEEANELIQHVVEGASRMQTLILDLLGYSRVGTQPKEFAKVDSAALLKQALANLQAAIEENGATVTAGPLPSVSVDPAQMTQLFQNLVGNALKYRGPRPPEIRVEACRLDQNWKFSVRDNGIGIESQYFKRIFVLFQRLHTRSEYPGTGIGLALCQKIVERYGGRIWVESAQDQGSVFYFTIPAGD